VIDVDGDAGNCCTVRILGDTMRRMTGPWSPAVHALLRHLDGRDLTEAPRLLGLVGRGREILTYIDGEADFFSHERVAPSDLWSDQVVIHAATL
jgi:hypothetical protein